jgi:hypothetical protein
MNIHLTPSHREINGPSLAAHHMISLLYDVAGGLNQHVLSYGQSLQGAAKDRAPREQSWLRRTCEVLTMLSCLTSESAT